MAKRTLPTEADYVAIAVNPALVTVMVTSLVWFLLEIFYSGQHGARLQWSLTMFVVIIVGTARIAMEEGWEKASLYGPIGAVVVWLAMQKFMAMYGPEGAAASNGWINAAIMAIVWVTAHMLTWDSTWVDEKTELPDEGLLQAAGLDGREAPASTAQRARASWWRRWIGRMRRPHAPGLWVVYYSLGALPIFGLGQMLIPARDAGRRQYAFALCTAYVAAALALLVGTSFLGLRRYLRQRGMQMPAAMIGTWITTGGVLIATVMLLAMLLPRPSPEYEISALPVRWGSPSGLQPNRRGVGNDGERPRDETPGTAASTRDADRQAPSSGSGGDRSPQPNGSKDGANRERSEQGSDSGERASTDADRQDATGSGQGNAAGQSSGSGGQQSQAESPAAGGQQSGETKSDSGTAPGSSDQQAASDAQANQPDQQPAEAAERTPREPPPDDVDRENERRQATGQSVGQLQRALLRSVSGPLEVGSLLLTVLKWGLYLALIAAVVLAIWYNRHRFGQFLAGLSQGWRDFWHKLFDWREPEEVAAGAAPAKRRRPSFGLYRDPFRSDKYRAAPIADLVRYSYAALEAWAADAGLPRRADETSLEFARRLGEAAPPVAASARAVADLYSRVHYGGRSLPSSALDDLGLLWQALSAQSPEYLHLESAAPRVVAAAASAALSTPPQVSGGTPPA